jgi:hypothetical protein
VGLIGNSFCPIVGDLPSKFGSSLNRTKVSAVVPHSQTGSCLGSCAALSRNNTRKYNSCWYDEYELSALAELLYTFSTSKATLANYGRD